MKRLYVPLIIMIFLIGCAYNTSLTNTSYNTLKVSKTTYETTMQIVSDLYKQGNLSEEKKEEIIKVAGKYKKAHNEAVQALKTYKELKDKDSMRTLENKVILTSQSLRKLLHLIEPYIGEKNE